MRSPGPALLLAAALAIPIHAQPDPGTGSIEGLVSDSATGVPLRKAVVELAHPRFRLSARTDADGRFQFTALPAGSYRLSAKRPGYLDRSMRRPVMVEAGARAKAEIRLTPQAAISGRVFDEDGDPLGGARVWLFRQSYRDGGKQWRQFDTTATTNDVGEYRFANLTPGRYIVKAMNLSPLPVSRYGALPATEYPPAFHRNGAVEQQAIPLEAAAGSHFSGADIHLSPVPFPPMFQVSGRVVGVPGRDSEVSVNLIPLDPNGIGGSVTTRLPEHTFQQRVRRGRYEIRANVYSAGPEAFASETIDVDGDSVVALTMSPPPVVSARIRIAGDGKLPPVDRLKATLRRGEFYRGEGSKPDSAGRIGFPPSLSPGTYSLTIADESLPPGFYFDRARTSGREIALDRIEIHSSTEIEILLAPGAATVTGTATDSKGTPFEGARVALYAAEPGRRPRLTTSDERGRFSYSSLRPGRYLLLAFEELDEDLWQDPDYRAQYASKAVSITASPGEAQPAPVAVIPAP